MRLFRHLDAGFAGAANVGWAAAGLRVNFWDSALGGFDHAASVDLGGRKRVWAVAVRGHARRRPGQLS